LANIKKKIIMGLVLNGFENFKKWYESKTIIGIIIAAVSTLVAAFYPQVDIQSAVSEVLNADGIVQGIDGLWTSIGQIVGLALALWGRVKAKTGIAA
jgi:hypothetical protein